MKRRHISRWIPAAALLVAVSAAPAQTSNSGHVNFQGLASSILDPYTNSPANALINWFTGHFFRMGVFSPYFDNKTWWYSNGLVYKDLYGIPVGSPMAYQHPDWILHDQYGNYLYIPWGCNGSYCAQYAGDVANPAFRAQWISDAGAAYSHGYRGFWLDDVNMEFRVSDANGNQLPPMDYNTGTLMTWTAWRSYIAQFTRQIRQSFPNADISHNVIWFSVPNGAAPGLDPYIKQEIQSANVVNLERGIATDPGLTGGTGFWSIYNVMQFIDTAHSFGTGVNLEEYNVDSSSAQYGLASYFMIAGGNDRIGDGSTTPDNWWSGYSVDIGTDLGYRTYNNGVFQRNFTGGIVLLGEPGLSPQTVNLPGYFQTLDGQWVNSVTLSGRQGFVLLGNGAAAGGNPGSPSPAPTTTSYLSDLNPTPVFQSFGTMQKDQSVGGNTLSIGGTQYGKGLGVHAYSEIHYTMGAKCSRFTATTGVDDEVPAGAGWLYFQVWADGWPLYSGPSQSSGSGGVPISVDVTGFQSLSLVVTNGNYDAQAWMVVYDHADWANAQLTCTN